MGADSHNPAKTLVICVCSERERKKERERERLRERDQWRKGDRDRGTGQEFSLQRTQIVPYQMWFHCLPAVQSHSFMLYAVQCLLCESGGAGRRSECEEGDLRGSEVHS